MSKLSGWCLPQSFINDTRHCGQCTFADCAHECHQTKDVQKSGE